MDQPVVILRAQDFGDFAMKLTGMGLLFWGGLSLPSIALMLIADVTMPKSSVWGSAFVPVGLVLTGVLLMRFSARIARFLFGSLAEHGLQLPSVLDLQTAAIRVLGVYFLGVALAGLARSIVWNGSDDFGWNALDGSEFAFHATLSSYGIVLLLYRSSWILHLVKRLRSRRSR